MKPLRLAAHLRRRDGERRRLRPGRRHHLGLVHRRSRTWTTAQATSASAIPSIEPPPETRPYRGDLRLEVVAQGDLPQTRRLVRRQLAFDAAAVLLVAIS
jgi:hypothetical protein